MQPQPGVYDPTTPTGYAPQQPFMQQPMMQAQMQPLQNQQMAQQYVQQQMMYQQQMAFKQPRMQRPGWTTPRLTKAGILGIVILVLSITGLIMDASGTPWIWSDNGNGTLLDGEEMLDEIDDFDEQPPFVLRMMLWPTTIMILGIVFSVPLIVIDLVPMPKRVQGGLHGLFLLANGTCGIFMMMSFGEWLGSYFNQMFAAGDMEMHMHVMVYYNAILGLALGASFMLFESSLEKVSDGWKTGELQRPMYKVVSNLMFCAVIALVFTPLFPIAWQSYSDDYKENEKFYDEDDGSGEPLAPLQFDALYFSIEESDSSWYPEWDEVEEEAPDTYDVIVNKARLHDYFLVVLWVQLSLMVMMLGISLPKMQKIMEGVCQINALLVGFLIPIVIFTILMYISIPGLHGEFIVSDSTFDGVSFHLNWFLPLAALLVVINWFVFLFRIHIPWWKKITAKDLSKLWMDNNAFGQPMMQQPMVMQQPMQQMAPQAQQQMVQQQQMQQMAMQQQPQQVAPQFQQPQMPR